MKDESKTKKQLIAELNELRTQSMVCKQMEETLQKSDELFSKVFHFNPNAMAISTFDGKFIDINESFLQITGYSREEVIGQTTIGLNIWVNMDNRTNARHLIFEKGQCKNLDVSFRIKSGEVREGLFSTEEIDYLDGKYILGIFIDITEKRRIEKEMARLDRLNLVGKIAAGIGHEVRNPLTSVRGFLQLLKSKKETMKHIDYYDLMIDELDKANSIISQFLSIARDKAIERKRAKISNIVKELIPIIEASTMNLKINVQFDLLDVNEVLADKKEISQLIINLVNNGLEAMESGGTLTIRTYMDNDDTVLFIQDQGKGIPSDIIDKIGTPFFTTKETGTGLGLAICYGIAARHNATINIETGPSGTSFLVRFK